MADTSENELLRGRFDDGIDCLIQTEIVWEDICGETSSITKLALAGERQWLDLGRDFQPISAEPASWNARPLYPSEASEMIERSVHLYGWNESLATKVVDLLGRGLLPANSQLLKGIERGEWLRPKQLAVALQVPQLTPKLSVMFLKTFCKIAEIELNLRHPTYKDPLRQTLHPRNYKHFLIRLPELKEHWGTESEKICMLVERLHHGEPNTDVLTQLRRLAGNLESAVWSDADSVTSRSNSIEPTTCASAREKKAPEGPSDPQGDPNSPESVVNNYVNCTFATNTEYSFSASQTNTQVILNYGASQAEKQSAECNPNSRNGSQDIHQHDKCADQVVPQVERVQDAPLPSKEPTNVSKAAPPDWFDQETQELIYDIFFAMYLEHFDSLSGNGPRKIVRISSETITAIKKLLFGERAEFNLASLSDRIKNSLWSKELKSFAQKPNIQKWKQGFRHLLIIVLFPNPELTKVQISAIVAKLVGKKYSAKNIGTSLQEFLMQRGMRITIPAKNLGVQSKDADLFPEILRLLELENASSA